MFNWFKNILSKFFFSNSCETLNDIQPSTPISEEDTQQLVSIFFNFNFVNAFLGTARFGKGRWLVFFIFCIKLLPLWLFSIKFTHKVLLKNHCQLEKYSQTSDSEEEKCIIILTFYHHLVMVRCFSTGK